MSIKHSRVFKWLDERVDVSVLHDLAEHKSVPVHRMTVFYYFGGMTLFFFIVQVLTGILLMLYYRPSAGEAFESVEFIMTTVPFGWLLRSIHSWSANLMIFFAFAHLATVFFMKAYRPPREITWLSGCLLLFLAMAFGFSGYLLPWNQLAFFATKVGTDIASAFPVIGEWLLRFLRGGDRVTGGTLSRFYGWHVAILPFISAAFLGLHLILVQTQGMSVPPQYERDKAHRRPMKFVPDFLLRDLFGWTLALGALWALAALFPWELGEKADPFAPAYKDIKPEWYFMFMFQTLKFVPGGEILGIEYEAIPILLFLLGAVLMVLTPFLDRGVARTGRSPVFTIIGWISLAYVVAMTAWGYHSWVPVYVILVTGLLVAVLALGTRRLRKSPNKSVQGLLFFLFAWPLAGASQAADLRETSCIQCHRDPELFSREQVEAIVGRFQDGVHARAGLSCHDCHGGNPDLRLADDMDAAMDPAFATNPYLGVPDRTQIPGYCGRCHSDPNFMRRYRPEARIDQEREYWTSHHGLGLKEGKTDVATCVDCHGVHGIYGPTNPESPVYPTQVAETCNACHGDAERMKNATLPDGRPLPVDQYARWRQSVHATTLLDRGDLTAPTCNDCHGNHGATPPGFDSVTFVCGQCHGREAELFRESPKHNLFVQHRDFLDGAGQESCAACHEAPDPAAFFTGEVSFSECTACHGNHSIIRPTVALLAPLPPTPCSFCHEVPGLELSPEPAGVSEHFMEVRERLTDEADSLNLEGSRRFDWLVDRALELPNHTLFVRTEEGERQQLRPEFSRLFEKFRIGRIHYSFIDPVDGAEVEDRVRRCTDCHSNHPALADEAVGLKVAQHFLGRMHELTAATAGAERILLAARRGGVEVREGLLELDKAVDAQIQLEVLVHTFDNDPEGPFMKKQAEGLEAAHAAAEDGQRGLQELHSRRLALSTTLTFVVLVLIGLGLKIGQIERKRVV
jgi:cytochrome b6